MSKENQLYADTHCGACREAIEFAQDPRYRQYVEIIAVNESTEAYHRMAGASVTQTPTLVTRDGQRLSSPKQIGIYLEKTYGVASGSGA